MVNGIFDHKIPLKYKQDGISPTLEEVAKRLHYTNTQPLWATDNIFKRQSIYILEYV